MLTACELADITAAVSDAMPDLAVIKRATKTSDGKGGKTAAWATLATDVPCEVEPIPTRATSTAERVAADRVTVAAEFAIKLPADQDITERDRIVVLGRTFEVTVVQAPGSLELERLCNAVEVR